MHTEFCDQPVVIAVQLKRKAENREVTLDKLIEFFVKEGLTTKLLAEKIRKVKDIRNTFHLT